MLMKNSKFIPGIGRESTERYSSLNRLLTAPFSESSAHFNEIPFSKVRLFMKYGGSLPVKETSFDDMVWRSL